MDDEHEPAIDEAASEPEKPRATPEPTDPEPERPATPAKAASEPEKPAPTTPRSEPFWNSKGFVAFLALLGAAIAPVMSWIAKDAEIRLAEADHAHAQALAAQEQRHKIRMDYFSRAIDPANDADYRERVLRFLRRSEDDPPLQSWAQEELEIIAPEAQERRQEEAENRARLRALAREVRDAQARAESETAAERARRIRAERELAELRGPAAEALRMRCDREYQRCADACDRPGSREHTRGMVAAARDEPAAPEQRGPAVLAIDRLAAEARGVFACRDLCMDALVQCLPSRASASDP